VSGPHASTWHLCQRGGRHLQRQNYRRRKLWRRVTLNAGVKVDAFSSGLNLLYVPDRKLLGGNLGLSVTIPAAYVNYEAYMSGAPVKRPPLLLPFSSFLVRSILLFDLKSNPFFRPDPCVRRSAARKICQGRCRSTARRACP
jgi:hypothetical protein